MLSATSIMSRNTREFETSTSEELVCCVLVRPGGTRRVMDKVKTTGEVRCRWGGGTISTKSDVIW